MKFGTSSCWYSTIVDKKFDFGNFTILGDMTSQIYSSHERNESSNSDICLWKMGLTIKTYVFFSVKNRFFSDPKLTPCLFQQFPSTGGVRYGSQTPIFKARSSQDQNYDGRKEC